MLYVAKYDVVCNFYYGDIFHRQAIEVDYDRDNSGLYRAKSRNSVTANAKTVMESSKTKVDTPFELIRADQVPEEDGFYDSTVTNRFQRLNI